MKKIWILVSVLLGHNYCSISEPHRKKCWEVNQANHRIKTPDQRIVNYLVNCLHNQTRFDKLVRPLLVARPMESPGHASSRVHLVSTLSQLGWSVDVDTFSHDTIIGTKTFNNVIATWNKASPRRMVLAAHYDSKITPKGFIGATDSAVPCAMLLDLASSMSHLLPPPEETPELSLQLIFFDGEEAFKSWTDTDSLYGSRNLANKWHQNQYTVSQEQGHCQDGTATELERMDMLVLLDLLGTKDTKFKNYRAFDGWIYKAAAQVETQVRRINRCSDETSLPTLFTNSNGGGISDDHLPFQKFGLSRILHLISDPFPSVWHTLKDDEDSLDQPSINIINKILRVFVYGYLHL